MRDVSDNQQWQAPGGTQPPPPVAPPAPPAPPPPSASPVAPPPPPAPSPAPSQALPQGWTPPPKPGIVPLRPMTLGTILGASFQVMRRSPRTTLLPALVLALVAAVAVAGGIALVLGSLSRIDSTSSVTDQSAIAAGAFLVALLAALVGVALTVAAGAVLQALIVESVARGTVGEKRTFGQTWARVKGRIGAIIGFVLLIIVTVIVAVILVSLIMFGVTFGVFAATFDGSSAGGGAVAAGLISMLVVLLLYAGAGVLWAWIGTKLAFVPSAIVLERLGVGGAIARSWRLTRRSFWRTFGILLLVYAMVYIAGSLVSTPIQLLSYFATGIFDPTGATSVDPNAYATSLLITLGVSYVVVAVVNSIGMVLEAATQSLLYLDLRFRKEGLDLELARYVEQRQAGLPVDDPFLPQARPVA